MHKNKFRYFIFILLAGILVGCSNHQSNKTQSPRQNVIEKSSKKTQSKSQKKQTSHKVSSENSILAKLKKLDKKELVYASFGDSISVGLFADSNSQKFTELVRQELTKKTSKPVTGDQVAEVGKTATNFGVPNLQNIIKQNPDLVTIEFGTNDAVGGVNNVFFEQFKSSMEEIITSLQKNTNAQLILVTTWSPPNGRYSENDLVYDKEIIALGQKYKVPVANLEDIWQNDQTIVGPVGATIPDFSTFGVRDDFHPNQKGHQSIANKVMQVIEQQGE